jgi:hypothetical protein
MRWTRVVVVLAVLSATVVVAGSAASGREASGLAPVVLHLKFRPVIRFANGHCGGPIWTSGRYALVSVSAPNANACATRFLLIDNRTGKRTFLHGRGLTEMRAFGAPWIFLLKDDHDVLYNITTNKTRGCGASGCVPKGEADGYALGSRWLETFVQQPGPCGDGEHNSCGPVTQSFYNINTGRFRDATSWNATAVANLNSPRLFHHVCPPLRVPSGGSLAFYGSFAVAATDRTWLLERCGSSLQIPIGMSYQDGPISPPVAGTHAVVWQVIDPLGEWHGQIAGVLLPSLRRFAATIPSKLHGFELALSASRLYLGTNGRVWAARIPGWRPLVSRIVNPRSTAVLKDCCV